jgi:hypothetical protein
MHGLPELIGEYANEDYRLTILNDLLFKGMIDGVEKAKIGEKLNFLMAGSADIGVFAESYVKTLVSSVKKNFSVADNPVSKVQIIAYIMKKDENEYTVNIYNEPTTDNYKSLIDYSVKGELAAVIYHIDAKIDATGMSHSEWGFIGPIDKKNERRTLKKMMSSELGYELPSD